MRHRGAWISIALWLLCAACFALQLLIPPFIGLADNADFGKVAGHLSLQAPDRGASNFLYFQPVFVYSAANHWISPYESSETALAWIAAHLAGATREGAAFDIRVLGALHLALFLGALAILLQALSASHPVVRIAVGAITILAFTDVCYAAYCNSFYMDTAALCGLLLLAATACWIAVTPLSTVQVGLYGVAGLIFCVSKTQHAIWVLLPAGYLAIAARNYKRTSVRRFAYATSGIMAAASVLLLATADPTNRAQALFNKLFFQIGVQPGGAADLLSLGVRSDELRYIGTHSYTAGSPALDRQWAEAFYFRTGYARLLTWYARHPARTGGILWNALTEGAPAMRQQNLSNFRREDGHPPGARTDRFAVWSNLRASLFARWPWHILIWYALFIAVATLVLANPVERPLALLALDIAALGVGQFLVAALADCLETGRHLFLFHACTDLTICFAVAFLATRLLRSTAR